jgi:hypothetical protein
MRLPAASKYTGRTVAGLPLTRSEFMMLPPCFSRFNEPPQDGTARTGINERLLQAVRIAFGDNVPPPLVQVAEYVLASVLYHWDFLRATLPPSHRLFTNALVMDETERQALSQLVICVKSNTAAAQREQRSATGA